MAGINMKNLKNKPYIIAEIGANHNGNIKLAKDIITEAKNCGADCIKFQIKLDPFEIATKDHSIALNNGKVVLENISSWKDRSNGLKNIFDQVKKAEPYLTLPLLPPLPAPPAVVTSPCDKFPF